MPNSATPAGPVPDKSRDILELLVYVIHPESAACIGNHILKFSQFSCQRRDTWVASITLRSWRKGSKPQADKTAIGKQTDTAKAKKKTHWRTRYPEKEDVASKRRMGPFQPGFSDDNPISLPTKMKSAWKDVAGIDENLIFELDMSSIIMSTNSFGDFSKCTIISELLDENQMKSIVEAARKLWQKFVHQPRTARCLVFFLLLGELCKQITEHYEENIKTLTYILKLDVSQHLLFLTRNQLSTGQFHEYGRGAFKKRGIPSRVCIRSMEFRGSLQATE